MTKPLPVERPSARLLADGKRLHLQHGPIDLIIEAEGTGTEVRRAYEQARQAFETVLDRLVAQLPRLRSPEGLPPHGDVARRMHAATQPFKPEFITPMAAVAGSIADHVLDRLIEGRALSRAYVNNGGDIALRLHNGVFRIGICDNPLTGETGGVITVLPDDGIGGIATSGWRGRSHSLGIADAVTVLARTAAGADAAATLIANKVDLPASPLVDRRPARELAPDSDLGARLVTVGVARLTEADAATALTRGELAAARYLDRALFRAAYLGLAGQRRTVARSRVPAAVNFHLRKEPACA